MRKAAYRSCKLHSKEKLFKLYKRLNRDKQIVMHTHPLLCNWTHVCVLLVVILFNHSKAFLLPALRVSELTRAETQGGRSEYSQENKQNKMWRLDWSYVMSLTSSLTSAYLTLAHTLSGHHLQGGSLHGTTHNQSRPGPEFSCWSAFSPRGGLCVFHF